MKNLKKISFLIFFFYLPFQSMAWGVLGHRIVGQIADSYLTKKAKKSILEILGNESVALCSNWADFIKSDPSYGYLSKWHYVNLKQGLTKNEVIKQLETDTAANAYTKLSFLITSLKNKDLPSTDKAVYLKFLIHLVGDIYQPLHVGRPDDLGGNKIKVSWFNTSYNLHQIWDEVLINFQQLSYTEYASAINFTTKDQRKAWQKEPASLWFYQSYEIAEKIYGDIKSSDEKLSYPYNYKYIVTVNEQLLKAGVQLAGILNEIYR